MVGRRDALGRDVRDKLGALGYLAREPRDAALVEAEVSHGPEPMFLVDGPGLYGYVMSARQVADFASGHDVSRPIQMACPRCGARLEERVQWAPRTRQSANRLRKIRWCSGCSWNAGF